MYSFLLLCFFGLANVGHSCNTAHIATWTLSVENGVATAKCCPKNGARVSAFLLWPNGSSISSANYSTYQDGCDGIFLALSGQHCHIQVVCSTYWESQLNEAKIGLVELRSSCSDSNSNEINLLQVCSQLNSSAQVNESTATKDSPTSTTPTTSHHTTLTTPHHGTVLSTTSTTTIRINAHQNNIAFSVPPTVIILIVIVASAFTFTIIIFYCKNRQKKDGLKPQQAVMEEGTFLLNSSDTRSAPSNKLSSNEEVAEDCLQPAPMLFSPSVELPTASPCSETTGDPQNSSKDERITCIGLGSEVSASTESNEGGTTCTESNEEFSATVLQATGALLLPRSLSRDMNDVATCITEQEAGRWFKRSVSCPNRYN